MLEPLTPHPSVILSCALSPGTLVDGLALVDDEGAPALICRCWRQPLLADDDIGDHEYTFEGAELLATEAVLAKVSSLGIGELLTASSATSGEG
ncbi:hypothetical protein B7486_55885 [cyanobacterium TDX16]|nr:hypothetical protein B7486_55885 [cyanobacterium TDX16]